MKHSVRIHSSNAKGRYYVDQNTCLCSDHCAYLAPENFSYNSESGEGYYVVKQMETSEEEYQCEKALYSCPVEAIHDDGEN